MKRNLTLLAVAALILPALIRGLWFYTGFASRPRIATPDYKSLTMPTAPVETPMAVADENVKALGGTVVADYAHTNQFQMGEVQSLKEEIERRGGKLEFNADATLLNNSLKYASAYVIISPSVAFSSSEIHSIQEFVGRGGRLLVFTDATRGVMYYDFNTGNTLLAPDVNAVNPLLANFGISVNNDYLYNLAENEGNFRNVYFNQFGKDELTFGLKQVALYGTHSIRSDSGLILFPEADSTLSSVDDAHNAADGAAALSPDGNVAVFGDFTFLTTPYNNVADNATLIANLADFLLSGKRTTSMANFPYLFRQSTVQVFPTSEVQMTAELISSLAKLQSSLGAVNVSVKIASEKPTDGDSIVLGTFTPSDDLKPYLKPFDLVLDDFNEFVDAPGFGKVGKSGNGIVLFEPGSKGNTVVLLADSIDDLTLLLDTLSSGSLDSCVFQGNMGVCSVGFGGSFSIETPTEVPATGEPTQGEPVPTPTAGG